MAAKATGPTIGLDIGSAFIKVVEMRPGRGSPRVAAIGIAPTPPNTFAGDMISDPVTLGGAVKKLLQESGITTKTVVTAVSGQTSFAMRILPVPKMSEKELAESMKWEVERHIPFRPEEAIQDFRPLPAVNESQDPNEMPVLLVVGQKQLIDNYVSTLLFAGLKPAALDVEPLSLERTAPLAEVRGGCTAFVNIGASKTDIGVFDRGILVYPRSIAIAGNNFTRSIADNLGLTADQAERIKMQTGEIPEHRQASASVFDEPGGGFGAFDIPDFGTPAAEDDFGLGSPLGAQTQSMTPEPEPAPAFGGFTMPEDNSDPGGIAFTLDDEDAAPPAGGFSFALDDDEPTSTPAPSTPTQPVNDPLSFSLEPDVPTPGTGNPTAPVFGFGDEPGTGFNAPSTPSAANPTGGSEMAVPQTDEERHRRQVGDALVPVYNDLMQEIRRSLEVYVNRPGGRPVGRVYLSGGTARLRGLAHALEQDLGVSVTLQDPSRNFPLLSKNVQPGYYAEIGPVIALAIGLGIRDQVEDPSPEPKAVRPTKKTAVAKA